MATAEDVLTKSCAGEDELGERKENGKKKIIVIDR
jgi:hypothetical protein